MDQEDSLQLERLSVAHPFATTKDNGVVYDDKDGGLLQGRHGGLASLKSEILSWVTHDGLPGLAEDRPEMHAERTVYGWDREGTP